MKKVIGTICFLLIAMNVFAQENRFEYLVNKCVSLLGAAIPDGFYFFTMRTLRNPLDGEYIEIIIDDNNKIISSKFGLNFVNTNEAMIIHSLFIYYLENNGWQFYDKKNGNQDALESDIYVKDGIYAYIPIYYSVRYDNASTVIQFSKTVDNFY